MKKRKPYNHQQTMRQRAIGLSISWYDTSPLMDSSGFMPGNVCHSNPIYNLSAGQIYRSCKNWLVHQQPFYWQVTITVKFNYPDGTTQNEIRELLAYTQLDKISEHCEQQFKDAMRHGNEKHYTTTHFLVQCLGNKPKQQAA